MSEFTVKICDMICSIIRWGGSPAMKGFSDKAKQLRGAAESSGEAMKRLEILTEEMSVRSNEIRSHEKLLSIAADYLESPIWGKDTDSHFVFMNSACAEKILKTDVDDAMRVPDEDHELGPLEEVCMKSDVLVQDTMKTHRFFEHARFDDGTDLWLDTTKSPWVVNSELAGTVGIGQDITDYISKEIRDKYFKSGYVEIDVDLLYNSNDIPKLLEGNL